VRRLALVVQRIRGQIVHQHQKIEASQLPAEEKSRLKAALQTLGHEAWSEVARRLATEALDHWPQAIAWLQTLRG